MKILFLSTNEPFCGIATYTKNLAASLRAHHDVDIYQIPPKVDFQYFTKKEIRSFFREFVRYAKDFDIIHIQYEYGLLEGGKGIFFGLKMFQYMLQSLSGKKVIVTLHSEPIDFKDDISSSIPFFTPVSRAFMVFRRWFAWHTCVSGFFRSPKKNLRAVVHTRHSRWRFENAGFAQGSLQLIRHGVVPHHHKEGKRSELLESKAKKKKEIVLSIFGFVSEYKGYLTALDILNELPENYRLQIIGGKPRDDLSDFLGRILEKVDELELRERVIISGFVSEKEIATYFQKTDICLAPYNFWGLSSSGALTWALTSGKPIVASTIHAFREVNFESECLVLAHPESPHEFAWAIEQLAADTERQKKMVSGAQKYANLYSWDIVGDMHNDLYMQV